MFIVCENTSFMHTAHSVHDTRAKALRWIMEHGMRAYTYIIYLGDE